MGLIRDLVLAQAVGALSREDFGQAVAVDVSGLHPHRGLRIEAGLRKAGKLCSGVLPAELRPS